VWKSGRWHYRSTCTVLNYQDKLNGFLRGLAHVITVVEVDTAIRGRVSDSSTKSAYEFWISLAPARFVWELVKIEIAWKEKGEQRDRGHFVATRRDSNESNFSDYFCFKLKWYIINLTTKEWGKVFWPPKREKNIISEEQEKLSTEELLSSNSIM
jgi:hypothetical protein